MRSGAGTRVTSWLSCGVWMQCCNVSRIDRPKHPSRQGAAIRRTQHCASGDRRRIEEGERVLEAPPLRPGLAATAGNLEHCMKQVPTDLLDAGFTCRNAAGIEIDEVVPAAREIAARGNFDHRTASQAIGRASH